jgi:hypothetical protein
MLFFTRRVKNNIHGTFACRAFSIPGRWFFASLGEKPSAMKIKYHAAVRPECACPELVEGSKGRLKLRFV